MATYKMLSAQRGVRKGDVHPVLFEEGKTYDIDDDLAAQFDTLKAVEPSKEEPAQPLADDDAANLHENWLDTDPAVLRHGELTAKEVIAKDESPLSDTAVPAEQEQGKAEGEDAGDESEADDAEGKPASKSKKSK